MELFTKPGCEKCDWVKANLPAGVAVTTHDILTAEGLSKTFHVERKAVPVLSGVSNVG